MPEPTDLDLLVSADLDGDLEGLALELGVSVAELRTRMTTPEAQARRRELDAARAALATPVAAVDDVTRQRMLDAARGADPSARSAWPRVLAAAAVLAVVVLGAGALYNLRGSDSSASRASSGSANSTASTPSGDLGDLGRLSEDDINAFLGGAEGKAQAREPAPSATDAATRSAADAGVELAPVAPADVARCVEQYGSQGTIRFQGGAILNGRPAVLLGIASASGERTIVLVVAADNCSDVLYSASR